ncbi:hypothetical protein [Romboutsia timonensis]|uniref:hypothetical protein n=1 Tax=Romboutsia timonensis TaxID=1776391 RepID=UPI002A83F6B3|nr:hypothetical protein [Romboutsia timonensis]MDY3960550.1 hypothetical protein [Romboutsia timonensis]
MTRLKRVQKTVKAVEKNKEVNKTMVKRLRKLGIGTHEVQIINAEQIKGKEHLIKLVLKSIKDGRKGVFVIPVDGFIMDNLLEIVYGEFDEEEFCLEDLIGNKVIAEIVRNGKFLNVEYFESIDTCNEEEIDEDELEDLELDEEEMELEDFELEGF